MLMWWCSLSSTMCAIFFFNDSPTTQIYTLSLHDALPISSVPTRRRYLAPNSAWARHCTNLRSEEHTSELQSHVNLVCRLLLEKKNGAATRRSDNGPNMATTLEAETSTITPLPLLPSHAAG